MSNKAAFLKEYPCIEMRFEIIDSTKSFSILSLNEPDKDSEKHVHSLIEQNGLKIRKYFFDTSVEKEVTFKARSDFELITGSKELLQFFAGDKRQTRYKIIGNYYIYDSSDCIIYDFYVKNEYAQLLDFWGGKYEEIPF